MVVPVLPHELKAALGILYLWSNTISCSD